MKVKGESQPEIGAAAFWKTEELKLKIADLWRLGFFMVSKWCEMIFVHPLYYYKPSLCDL